MRTLHATVGFCIVFHVVIQVLGSGSAGSRTHRHQHGMVRDPPTTSKDNATLKRLEQRKLLKQFRLATIQQQIMEKLGFEYPPNVTIAQTSRPRKIPMLAKMIRSGSGSQADQADRDLQADQEEAAVPMEILVFSKSRK